MLLRVADKDRVIMFHAATGKQVRNFYGASNGSYSNPRSSFSHSGKYVYCTTEVSNLFEVCNMPSAHCSTSCCCSIPLQDRKVVVWETLSEKLLHKLEGHLLTVVSVLSHVPSPCFLPIRFVCCRPPLF